VSFFFYLSHRKVSNALGTRNMPVYEPENSADWGSDKALYFTPYVEALTKHARALYKAEPTQTTIAAEDLGEDIFVSMVLYSVENYLRGTIKWSDLHISTTTVLKHLQKDTPDFTVRLGPGPPKAPPIAPTKQPAAVLMAKYNTNFEKILRDALPHDSEVKEYERQRRIEASKNQINLALLFGFGTTPLSEAEWQAINSVPEVKDYLDTVVPVVRPKATVRSKSKRQSGGASSASAAPPVRKSMRFSARANAPSQHSTEGTSGHASGDSEDGSDDADEDYQSSEEGDDDDDDDGEDGVEEGREIPRKSTRAAARASRPIAVNECYFVGIKPIITDEPNSVFTRLGVQEVVDESGDCVLYVTKARELSFAKMDYPREAVGNVTEMVTADDESVDFPPFVTAEMMTPDMPPLVSTFRSIETPTRPFHAVLHGNLSVLSVDGRSKDSSQVGLVISENGACHAEEDRDGAEEDRDSDKIPEVVALNCTTGRLQLRKQSERPPPKKKKPVGSSRRRPTAAPHAPSSTASGHALLETSECQSNAQPQYTIESTMQDVNRLRPDFAAALKTIGDPIKGFTVAKPDSRRFSQAYPLIYTQSTQSNGKKKQLQARHGSYLWSDVASSVSKWLSQSDAAQASFSKARLCRMLGRGIIDLLLPPAIKDDDMGKSAKLEISSSGDCTLSINGELRAVDWTGLPMILSTREWIRSHHKSAHGEEILNPLLKELLTGETVSLTAEQATSAQLDPYVNCDAYATASNGSVYVPRTDPSTLGDPLGWEKIDARPTDAVKAPLEEKDETELIRAIGNGELKEFWNPFRKLKLSTHHYIGKGPYYSPRPLLRAFTGVLSTKAGQSVEYYGAMVDVTETNTTRSTSFSFPNPYSLNRPSYADAQASVLDRLRSAATSDPAAAAAIVVADASAPTATHPVVSSDLFSDPHIFTLNGIDSTASPPSGEETILSAADFGLGMSPLDSVGTPDGAGRTSTSVMTPPNDSASAESRRNSGSANQPNITSPPPDPGLAGMPPPTTPMRPIGNGRNSASSGLASLESMDDSPPFPTVAQFSRLTDPTVAFGELAATTPAPFAAQHPASALSPPVVTTQLRSPASRPSPAEDTHRDVAMNTSASASPPDWDSWLTDFEARTMSVRKLVEQLKRSHAPVSVSQIADIMGVARHQQ
tara:strand:- start:2162 stop:5662 length:3501 start_codon:yes stop_codon:yes gene_type:complete